MQSFVRVWTSMNLTQIDLLRQLKKVKDNLTEQLNLTKVHLQTLTPLYLLTNCCKCKYYKKDSQFSIPTENISSHITCISIRLTTRLKLFGFHLNKSKKCCNKLDDFFTIVYDKCDISPPRESRTESKSRNRNQITQVQWRSSTQRKFSASRTFKESKIQLNRTVDLTTVHLQTSDASLFASLSEVNASITEKVNDVSKMAGPIGPPGYNGSQGPAGPAGSIGPPGPKGAGNFSSCQYKVVKDSAAGGVTTALVGQTEPDGKRITGATCSTNFATEYNMLTQLQATGKWRFACSCKGTSALFRPGGDKNCYLHYWECPLTT
ncbi:hypothetical protein OS493_035164 [Desmophyllum pertusum]|uniref:Uncharacterized protein n=1 Tax=Desmophyllum pertusum TaxID=174260 RepID=A0A9X0CJE3_9CNID|nr:hypothetical protein OS493_035164 [Desmophyllum pertusum]